ncbi:MAG: hypothetical protein ACXVEF_11885 [Polyangiales bacterium]
MRLAVLLAILCLSCRRDDVKADDSESKPKKTIKKPVRSACPFPKEEPIVSKVEIAARCDVSIDRDVHVGPGGEIRIGAGSRLVFAPRAGMVFDGGSIVARGTKDDPVLFTATTDEPGTWAGLSFPTPVAPPGMTLEPAESSLDHAIVEYAGGSGRTIPAGISVGARTVTRLRLSHVTFRFNASRGLYFYDISAYAGGDALVFRKNSGLSFDGDPDVLAETRDVDTDEPIRVWGVATRPLVMPRAPEIRIRRLIVDSESEKGASVTFPEGSIVAVEPRGEIRVGSGFPAPRSCAFTARKVTFRSTLAAPSAGDWVSIAVLADCPVVIEDSTVQHAEKGVQIPPGAKHVSVERTTFKDLTGAAFEATSCAPWRDPAKGNTATTKLCEESFGLGISGVGAGGSGIVFK